MRILLIDDDSADRSLVSLVLTSRLENARVRCISDGLEFAEALADGEFDVVVTDHRLHWADGLSLLNSLRSRFPRVPVLFLCGPVSSPVQDQLLEAGPDDFLPRTSSGFLRLPRAIQLAAKRSQLHQEKSHQEHRLDDLLSKSRLGYFRARPDGQLIDANPAMRELLGKSAELPAEELQLPLYFRSADAHHLAQRVDSEGATHRSQVRIDDEGRPRWIALVETAQQNETGEWIIDGLAEDITSSREAEESLRRSNEDLKSFASVAAHQLQEPLRMVHQYTRILHDEHRGQLDERGREFLRYAVDGARRMEALTESLLSLSKLDSGQPQFVECVTEEILQEAVHNLRVTIQESGADIQWDPLPSIRGECQQITQLFQNLIANAIKFNTADTPRVRIACRQHGGENWFTVADNGPGIASEQLEEIFSLFRRLDPDVPGSGIGLSICRRIAERHGGRIWAESSAGNGATFVVAFPVSHPG